MRLGARGLVETLRERAVLPQGIALGVLSGDGELGGAAADVLEDPRGFESCDAMLDGGPQAGVSPVRLLVSIVGWPFGRWRWAVAKVPPALRLTGGEARWHWKRQPRKSRPPSMWVIRLFSGERRRCQHTPWTRENDSTTGTATHGGSGKP